MKFSIYLNRRVFVMIYSPFQSDSSVAVLPFSSVEAFIMLHLFWRCLFLISSFGAREDCFVTVVFPGCLHRYFIVIFFFLSLSLYTAISPFGHSRQVYIVHLGL